MTAGPTCSRSSTTSWTGLRQKRAKGTGISRRATRQTSTAGESVRVSVSDTGIGIAEEDQERVFHEFQQVDGAASRHYEGTGLGLALTRRFAELHGGRIWLESKLGQGSTFHVEIPAQPLTREHPVSISDTSAQPDPASTNG